MRKALVILGLLIWCMMLVGPASQAALIQTAQSGVGGVTDSAVPGWDTEIGFVGQGRIGGTNTYEINLGLNTDTTGDFDQANFNWTQNTPYAFTLSFDGTSASLNIGGTQVNWSSFSLTDPFDGLAIRTSAYEGQSVLFTDLTMNTSWVADYTVGDFSNVSGASGSGRDVNWLLLSDFGDLAQGFTLTGNVALNWTLDPDPNLNDSKLAFQIKGANAPAVPLPGAVWLLGSGLLALVGVKRFRK